VFAAGCKETPMWKLRQLNHIPYGQVNVVPFQNKSC